MLESLNYSFRNPKNIIWVISRIKQLINYKTKNHGVLRGPQLGKQRWRARLGILRVKWVSMPTLCVLVLAAFFSASLHTFPKRLGPQSRVPNCTFQVPSLLNEADATGEDIYKVLKLSRRQFSEKFLWQTAASRCEDFPTFRDLTIRVKGTESTWNVGKTFTSRRGCLSEKISLDVIFFFLKRLIYCSEMYKWLNEFSIKTVPDTSLYETSDLI